MTSIRVTLAFVKVNVSARDSVPFGAMINPTDPLMSAGYRIAARARARGLFRPGRGAPDLARLRGGVR